MDPNIQKITMEMVDHFLNELNKENERLAISRTALKANNEQQRKILAELKMQNLTLSKMLLSTGGPKFNSATHFGYKIKVFGNAIKETSLQEKPFREQTAIMCKLIQQKESHGFNTCTMMPYGEVMKEMEKTRSATEAIKHEKQCLRDCRLSESVDLRQRLKQVQLETKACKELEKQQRNSKLEAECTLTNLNLKIKQLNADVAKLQAEVDAKKAKYI